MTYIALILAATIFIIVIFFIVHQRNNKLRVKESERTTISDYWIVSRKKITKIEQIYQGDIPIGQPLETVLEDRIIANSDAIQTVLDKLPSPSWPHKIEGINRTTLPPKK